MSHTVRVLHVDDEPAFGELVAEFLERTGDFDVEPVESAPAALDHLETHDVDCVVSDYDMPELDGIEFLEALREDYPDLPFVLFTGKGSEEVASDAISAGATDYLQKGGGTEQYDLLANRVRNAVEQHRSSERAANLARLRDIAAEVNQRLVRAPTRDAVERAVCETLASTDPYRFAWIGGVDGDAVRPRASAGDAADSLGDVSIPVGERANGGRAPAARALAADGVVTAADVAADDPPAEGVPADGDLYSVAAAPLTHDDERYGVLAVYADQHHGFDDDELALLAELADDVAHAVHACEVRADLERFRTLLDRSTDAVYLVDGETGAFVEANDRACRRLGYSRDELLSLHVTDVQRDFDDVDDFRAVVARAREEGSLLVEGVHEASDGTTYPVEVRVDTEELEGRTYVVAIARDVSDEHRRRERLRRQRNALVDLTTDDAVVEGDFEAAARRITETAADVLDVPRVNVWLFDDAHEKLECVTHFEGADCPDTDHVQELFVEHNPDYFQALEASRTIAAADAHDDPRTREFAASYLEPRGIGAVLDATLRSAGEVVGVVCHEHVGGPREWTEDEVEFAADVADVLHRALRNERRRERERELEVRQRAIEAAPVGITISDADGDHPIVYANDEFAAITGYDADDVRGRNHRFLQGPETDPERVAELRDAIADRRATTVELRNYRADGSPFWNRVTVAPVRDGDGRVTHFVGFQEDVTERKERERELARSERRFDAVFNDPNILAGILDSDGTVRAVNDTALSYVSADRGDVVGQAFWETPWWRTADREDVRSYVERAADGEYVTYEAEHVTPDGDQVAVTGVIRPVVADGDVEQLVVSARDVTERVHRERVLDAILENTTTPMFLKDADGEYVLANDAFCELFGLDADGVVGKTDEELFPASMAREVTRNDDRVLATGDPVEAEEQVVVDGERRTFLSSKVPLYDIGTAADDDAPVAVFGVASDVTDRDERERELARVRERMEFVLERTDSAIWEGDLRTGDVTTYPDPCPLLGRHVESFADFEAATHPEDRDRFRDALDAVRRTGDPTRVEYRTAGDGAPAWVETQIEPLPDSSGDGRRVMGVTRDVTERKEREQTLERQNERFDELASAVSHDLQTPLSTALGRLELAVRDGEGGDHVAGAREALERADELREDLVDVLRSRELVRETESVDVGAVAADRWETIGSTDAATLRVDDPPAVSADRASLSRLLENLLSNAIEHGGGDVTVTVGATDDGAGFFVADDGPGVPEDVRDKVFTAGFTTKDGGSGVGMASVREIAAAHDWTVTITDAEGGGARFEVRVRD